MNCNFPAFNPGSLVVVAGRPAMGKTRFLCSLAAERQTLHPVLYHSLELSEKQINEKMPSGFAVVDTPYLSLEDISESIRKYVSESDVRTVVIDYLQLIKDLDSNTILQSLKAIASELEIEIVVGALIKRAETAPAAAPTVNDLAVKGCEFIDEFVPLHRPK